ncbi:MAG: porin family protein [Bacteroidota bacterium]|jgi:hypothetical protein|nr:PorT family protein [Sphingobacteriales bacterium]
MKHFTLLVVLFFLFHFANSQSFVLGIKAGVNRSSMSTSLGNATAEPNYGFVAGAFARAGILGFYVQPEVQYNQRNASIDLGNGSGTQTLSYIDVPLLAGKKILGLARVYAGPNLQFLLDASQSGGKLPAFAQSNFNEFALGGIAGVGVDVKKITIDLRCDFSLTDLGKKVVSQQAGTFDYSTRATMFQFVLGYKFLDL